MSIIYALVHRYICSDLISPDKPQIPMSSVLDSTPTESMGCFPPFLHPRSKISSNLPTGDSWPSPFPPILTSLAFGRRLILSSSLGDRKIEQSGFRLIYIYTAYTIHTY
eukprot:GHVQ01041743.1.p1 GENE.GHVQ01041743.1~~GHVQ01041743.1.p1  ORF type:complete len:109 (+),score=5.08 GHVQ01041743.1:170-496(+)